MIAAAFLAGFAQNTVLAPGNQDTAKRILVSGQAPAPIGLFSQPVQIGDFSFPSRQFGLDPRTGNLPASVDKQTSRAMEN